MIEQKIKEPIEELGILQKDVYFVNHVYNWQNQKFYTLRTGRIIKIIVTDEYGLEFVYKNNKDSFEIVLGEGEVGDRLFFDKQQALKRLSELGGELDEDCQ